MPVDPITGQMYPYADEAVEAPLAMRMIEHLPGISATLGFSMMRGSNTMMYGGFMDNEPRFFAKTRQARRAKRFAVAPGGAMSTPGAGGFYGGISGRGSLGRRAQSAAAAQKTPFLRSARLNNITGRPRALTRFHSRSIFSGAAGVYTPFGASSFLGNTKMGVGMLKNAGIELADGEKGFGPGLFSGIAAGVKTDALEAKAARGSARAMSKLGKVDDSISAMLKMNKAGQLSVSGGQFGRIIPKSAGLGMIAPAGQTVTQSAARLGGITAANTAGTMGVRGNLQASALTGAFTGYTAGYARGALGFGGTAGLTGRALQGAQAAETAFGKAIASFGDEGFKLASGKVLSGADEAVKFLQSTGGGSLFKQLGTKGTMAVAKAGGAGMLATRAAALAIPGLNVLATASLVYDLGKMGGELIKSGINFAKDANRSLQGSIAKPAFGMGYKDTEAAATSRARGVAAIQNSRLNARSMLGAEGAMMAAHYG